MFIDTAGIILLEPQKKECQTLFIGDESGSTKEQIKNMCIPYDDPLLSIISKERKLITKYDIEEDPRYANLRESCGQRFSEMGASILTPFIYQGKVTGALALGYKKSGHFYTREDIDLLNTLANSGAVAIENARLAEQMKKEETVRTNLARYLSPQIVDQIIKKDVQVNLGGDRKVVTVLFSDIRNFTSITETRQPDQLVLILNEYFTEMAKIIFENQGSLDKYIGDAIVAVFGSLIPLDNSAKNAVQAAIQMMKHMPVLNEKWMKEYGFSMDIGIGINTGEVFLGNIGSPERMEFTVIGDTVNVASRFSGLAQPTQILITRETLSFLGNDVRYNELPAAAVKGKAEKLKVFEILYP
jgi:adenylate cyclase